MRLSARDVLFRVDPAPENARPVRMRAAGLVFGFTTAEALELANQLADAVAEVNKHQTGQQL